MIDHSDILAEREQPFGKPDLGTQRIPIRIDVSRQHERFVPSNKSDKFRWIEQVFRHFAEHNRVAASEIHGSLNYCPRFGI